MSDGLGKQFYYSRKGKVCLEVGFALLRSNLTIAVQQHFFTLKL